MKYHINQFSDIQLITSDNPLLNKSSKINYLPWDTASKSSGNSVNYNSKILIVDSKIPNPTGRRSVSSKNSVQSKIKSLDKNALYYLKSGGTIVYLLSEHDSLKQVENHSWLESLETVRVEDGKRRAVCPIAKSNLVNSYLEFIDTSDYPLNIRETEGMDVLAESNRKEKEALACVFDDYIDDTGRHRRFEGNVVVLPRPDSFEAVGDLLTEKLIGIGREFSPRGQSPAQRSLYEFSEKANQAEDKISTVLHDRLEERCLPKFERGEYADAATTAGQILEEEVREGVPEELNDMTTATLMKAAFSKNQGPLRFAERDDEQEGVMFLYAGAMQGVRNALSHRTPQEGGDRYLDSLNREKTRDFIYFVNFLLTLLEDYEEQ